ncbi:hypothetical protein GCM10009623_35580 [Nocardioides aestuarii]|uniref:Serine/threonine-protein kinase n=1 Tax=Nocardioides aestuarii TaxID=252231 RepID=A0ABW4TTH2_9ACTN
MDTLATDSDPWVVPPGEEVLPGYRVEALLARGGRADTYDATSTVRDCRVVVKVVRPDRLHEDRIRDALLLEGELLTTLTHPHLVRGYDVLRHPRPAVVLETLPGATLGALVEDRRLGVADAVVLGRQLVSVLGYLHHQGWLHLDLKPDNVVVQEGRAVLIDLGVARRPGTRTSPAGTEGYTAPEQETTGELTTATDVWGWGATVYAAVVGRAPGRHPDLRPLPTALRELVGSCLVDPPDARIGLDDLRVALDRLDGLGRFPRRGLLPWR